MPTEPSTRRDRDGLGRPFRLQRTEEPRLGRGAEHHVHGAPALAQPFGEPEQRSRSVATADERAGDRLLRQLERATERADDVDRVVRLQALHPAGAGAVRGEHDLDGAAVDARRPDPVDREGATQQRAGRLTADRECDEVARPGPLGDAVGDDRQVVVVTDPLDREHLATDLERSTLGARGAVDVSVRVTPLLPGRARAGPALQRPYAEVARAERLDALHGGRRGLAPW